MATSRALKRCKYLATFDPELTVFRNGGMAEHSSKVGVNIIGPVLHLNATILVSNFSGLLYCHLLKILNEKIFP